MNSSSLHSGFCDSECGRQCAKRSYSLWQCRGIFNKIQRMTASRQKTDHWCTAPTKRPCLFYAPCPKSQALKIPIHSQIKLTINYKLKFLPTSIWLKKAYFGTTNVPVFLQSLLQSLFLAHKCKLPMAAAGKHSQWKLNYNLELSSQKSKT